MATRPNARRRVFASIFLLFAAGCSQSKGASPTASASASASAVPPTTSALFPHPRPNQRPAGPALAVEAGKGIGPLRFGATVATIERLMEAPCEHKSDDRCRYINRGVELYLADGKLTRIEIHRFGRRVADPPPGSNDTYGIFNGAIPPYVRLGMKESAVLVGIGKPLRTEPVSDSPVRATRRLHYEGMVLELEEGPSGPMLSGITLTPAPSSPAR